MSLYEGMFLLDNQAVRADWKAAKSAVTETLEKHGGTVRSARRWEERKLAYPIKHRLRGTYVLAYYDLEVGSIVDLRRDLELSETVLRYLLVRAEEVPAAEVEKTAAEEQEGFAPPAPPEDDAPEPGPAPEAKTKPIAKPIAKPEAVPEAVASDEAPAPVSADSATEDQPAPAGTAEKSEAAAAEGEAAEKKEEA